MRTGGMPGNGDIPVIEFNNLGKTDAFILQTCIVLKASKIAPAKRYPAHFIIEHDPGTTISAGTEINVRGKKSPVALHETEITAIQTGEAHLWASGYIKFVDWFDIERTEPFMFRWVVKREAADIERRTGFLPHQT